MLNKNTNEINFPEKPNDSDKNFLSDYWNSFFYIYSHKFIQKFKEKNSNNFPKEILDTLSMSDLLKDKNELNEKKENNIINKEEILDKNNDDITMNDSQPNDEIESENIFEEIKDFISFDKCKNNNMNNIKIINKNNNFNNYNCTIKNNYIEKNNYLNELRNKFCHIPNNVKTIKACSPERNNDSFDFYPSILEKNPNDRIDYNNNFNNRFLKNNIYKNQQFQPNQIFNFKKQYEENPFTIEAQFQPSLPPYYLQKTVPLPYSSQTQIFPYNNININCSNSFYTGIPNDINKCNFCPLMNNLTFLKSQNPQNNNFMNNFNMMPSFIKSQIKKEGKYNYEYNENNSKSITPNISQEKKQKKKLKKKLFIKNNKLVYVINEKHTDTKDAIYLDEDSENCKGSKNQKNNKLNILQEKLAEERKPRSSKFRGVSKNGKHWQVLIMIKQKKRYIGNFIDEEEAAREYDKIAIQFHGPKAKTNFQYNEEEINSILSAPKLEKLSYLF